MINDFFIRALFAGIGIALITAPLGCFVIWRRLSYFGDTLSHSALLGVGIGIFLGLNFTISVFILCAILSLLLIFLQSRTKLPSDALLGLLSHSILAVGLVSLAAMTWVRFDLLSLLFGDILAVSNFDLWIIWVGGLFILFILYIIWKPLFADTVNSDIAKAEGMKTEIANLIYVLLLALVISMSLKIVGVLLITGLLILPAATSRNFSNSPYSMIFLAIVLSILSVISGLFASLQWDTPSGPSIIVASLFIFIISLIPFKKILILK
ncbi:MAG: High-affinity zinc uptake system membrane protein ZnuB [Alphaproteobacteria bacterium MarineAlpha2_Bin1]|nr:MAG: High-affinity zinc uptake system membrane protein ZnuB [Alphaproteobacteria bacterium MarineAlpha2_Bin1]|tara:strand:+ start:1326 stop:2126 length:801 start_codon:yes stop_codon:yes gene_type:complete